MFKFILSSLNNLSIGFKIAIGFLSIFILFVLMSFFIISKIENLNKSITDLSSLSQSSTVILDINKDISELQRMALVYG